MKRALAESIGRATREARARLGITQEDAAERIGVSVEFYSRIERGTSLPSVLTFARLALALGISADRLIGRSETGPGGIAGWVPLSSAPEDPPEVRSLFRKLRRASSLTIRVVKTMVHELERGLHDELLRMAEDGEFGEYDEDEDDDDEEDDDADEEDEDDEGADDDDDAED